MAELIEAWREWTDDLVSAEHRCADNTDEEIGVLHVRPGGSETPEWKLAVITMATAEDVASGRAPELGVPATAVSIKISFCPFCGNALE